MSILSGAHKVVINNSQLTNQVSDGSKGTGLEKLFKASIPGAAHDSSERYPPPICHPGTRQDYIENLTGWGINTDNHAERIVWVKGPAGVGKSAIAQSCAEGLGNKLGASFFFSRPNNRDDPDRFFTSLAYQLTENFTSYGTFLDNEIRRRPTLVAKALPRQFRDLFITPFADPTIREEVGERVIIVDGLDECALPEAQVDIVKIVAESARTRTTPFFWIFLSRLEPRIVTTFGLPDVKSVSQQVELPVSRETDREILLYLADGLQGIGRDHHLPLPWPSEGDVWALVDFSAGLFACAHAIILFVNEESPAGPVKQLHVVLQLAKRLATQSGSPLSALNELYTLIMERIPPAMLQTVRWTLLTTRVRFVDYAYQSANLLGLEKLQLQRACWRLHSVMVLGAGDMAKIAFYHASFMDFVEDPARSGRFCIWSDCAVTLLEELLRHLDQVQVGVDILGRWVPLLNLTWPVPSKQILDNHWSCYHDHLRALFKVLHSVCLNDTERLRVFLDFDFRKISFIKLHVSAFYVANSLAATAVKVIVQNLDSQLKSLYFHRPWNWWASFLSKPAVRYYTIGHGKKRAILKISADNNIGVGPYSDSIFQSWAMQSHEESKESKKALLS